MAGTQVEVTVGYDTPDECKLTVKEGDTLLVKKSNKYGFEAIVGEIGVAKRSGRDLIVGFPGYPVVFNPGRKFATTFCHYMDPDKIKLSDYE